MGTAGRGGGVLGSKGYAVDYQPRTSVDGHSYHDHQKRDLQVSNEGVVHLCEGLKTGKEGSRGEGLVNRAVFMKVLYIYVSLYMCARI
jgi:hypothetical protein